MFQHPIKALTVKGEVSPGYESIKELFIKNMHSPAEDKAQLCIYVKGEKVVDLYAAPVGDDSFTADSLVNVWSSGKSLEAIAMAHLVDRGLLDYDEKITHYWPEFAKNGKGHIKVSDLMRHQAGLQDLRYTFSAEDLLPENIKNNSVGRVIENASPKISPDARFVRRYHVLTRGWVVNEVFRRIEPTGRTIGEYLREEIAIPLGANAHIGVRHDQLDLIHKLRVFPMLHHFIESFKSKRKGRTVVHNILNIAMIYWSLVRSQLLISFHEIRANLAADKTQNDAKDKPVKTKRRMPLADISLFANGYKNYNIITSGEYARGESSSFASKCSARGLAKIAAMLANKGTFEGQQYFSEDTWQALHAKVETKHLGLLGSTHFSQGGLHLFQLAAGTKHSAAEIGANQYREGFYGWIGLGGSVFQWHPELELGFSFVPSSMHVIDGFNERAKVYQREAINCAIKMAQQATEPKLKSV